MYNLCSFNAIFERLKNTKILSHIIQPRDQICFENYNTIHI